MAIRSLTVGWFWRQMNEMCSGPRRGFMGLGSKRNMDPWQGELREVLRRRASAPEVHQSRESGGLPPRKKFKSRLLVAIGASIIMSSN